VVNETGQGVVDSSIYLRPRRSEPMLDTRPAACDDTRRPFRE